MGRRLQQRVVLAAHLIVAAVAVPGVPDSVGYLSSAFEIETPLDNRTGGYPSRYSFMLEGCCGWGTYNVSAPMLLHTEIDPKGAIFEADFTYDKLYDFFGGGSRGLISWWWAEKTHGEKLCVAGVGAELYLRACDETDAQQQFAYRARGGGGHVVHLASGGYVQAGSGADFVCSGKASSGCVFLEGPMSLAACDDAAAGQLWLAPRRPDGLDDVLKNISGGA